MDWFLYDKGLRHERVIYFSWSILYEKMTHKETQNMFKVNNKRKM